MLSYALEFTGCSAVFYALYTLLIEGKVAHRSARAYLLLTTLLSLLIPLLELPLYPAETSTILPTNAATNLVLTTHSAETAHIAWDRLLGWGIVAIYALITLLNFVRMAMRLREVMRLRRGAKLSFYEAYTLAESHAIKEPFSFWRTIYINNRINESALAMVVAHESSHIRHHHTAERLIMELLRCVGWFNPFVWLSGNHLIAVQEWEVDKEVIDKGYDLVEYRLLVFQQLYGYYPEVTCGLKSQTSKKRFLMMTNFKRGRFSPWRLCAAIPVIAGLIFAFGAVRAEAKATEEATPTVVEKAVLPQPESTETAALLQHFGNYCKQQIRYPSEAKAKGIDGRVLVEFSVNLADGSAKLLKTHRSADALLAAEVQRVIEVGKWAPIAEVADRPHPKVILTFDFMIDSKTDPSKFGKPINGIVVKTYAD